ncbi:GNAT family N-acetyltransferase [Staphylococcus sp. 17KM0847]|uniref:GNAT family N-acetyltransferase n=1 Tax=Staphylococcus sp. 17KM0847 TaxID=2583989 RepID=UPI0015DD0B5F|nr:GNAT family N-acetyltransferase [Staphylococcus sp. 17KM0847]QLK86183.1 GNAT family N-acetyltransferase [Staphylococcus sp. 17KM0847]
MIRKAHYTDLPDIMTLTSAAKALMYQDGNPQWDEYYPVSKHFEQDIHSESLFVLEDENHTIQGFIVIDAIMPEWYNTLEWPIQYDTHSLVIHRLVASQQYPGIAKKLMTFAFEQARAHDSKYLLTDTFSLNQRAQKLFTKYNFIKVGEMTSETFPFDKGAPFYAYYKKLD